ncbi:MAG: rRNA maturation RNase YbeY [Bacteroidales bacterium]
MSIQFFNESTGMPEINQDEAAAWLEETANSENKETGDCNIIFCSDDYLLDINKKYLDHHNYTDIVTFDYSEDNTIAGDLFISTDRIAENAKSYDVPFDQELHRVMVHGILHLCGYGDATDEEKKLMRSKEDNYLEKSGMM